MSLMIPEVMSVDVQQLPPGFAPKQLMIALRRLSNARFELDATLSACVHDLQIACTEVYARRPLATSRQLCDAAINEVTARRGGLCDKVVAIFRQDVERAIG